MSRWQLRRAAARAFAFRNRAMFSSVGVREPEHGETPLSESEIEFGVRRGIIVEARPAFTQPIGAMQQ